MIEYRIHGPPGCAKTTQLKESIGRAVQSFTSTGVLVTAFSKAAAHELVTRGLSVDPANIGTLHALCFRGLGKPVIAETCAEEWNESNRGMQIGRRKTDHDDLNDDEESHGDDMLLRSTTLRARMVPKASWPSDVRHFHERWTAWKARTEYLDFTDLLEMGRERMPSAPGNPEAIFVDEAQDLSPLEIALVRQWGKKAKYYVLCGDSDQCIYSFRGASPTSFLEPAIPVEQNRLLTQSYRVSQAVHAYAQKVIRRCRYRFAVDYLPTQERGSVRRAGYSLSCATDILRDVTKDLDAGKSVMVLSSCAYQLRPLLGALRGAGIPYHNPYRPRNLEWNPWSCGAALLDAVVRPVDVSLGGVGEGATYEAVYKAASKMRGVLAADGLRRAKNGATLWPQLRSDDVWWEQLLKPSAWDGLRKARQSGVHAAAAWYESALDERDRAAAYACRAVRRYGTAVLDATPALTVGTIHSVKGAEADVVYLSPDLSGQGFENSHKLPNYLDDLVRVFYVGATRARSSLVLLDPTDGRCLEF